MPISPGFHEIDCVTWRPKGALMEELKTQFIGGSTQLKVRLHTFHVQFNCYILLLILVMSFISLKEKSN